MHTLLRAARGAVATGLVAATAAGATGCSISRQQEIDLGQQYAAEINRQLPIVDDAEVHRYVNLLGREIARQGGRQLDYTFYVVNTDVINAFAVPGGFVYINRGLIERTDNLSELAGVLAHEVAHVELRHGVEQMEKLQRAQVGLIAATVLLGQPGPLARTAIDVGAGLYFAQNSREAEHEADFYAIPLLVEAGIHPNGLVTFFDELIAERERRPGQVEQWFSTHPLTEDRISETRARVNTIPRDQLARLTMTSENYGRMKARLERYPDPPPEFRAESR